MTHLAKFMKHSSIVGYLQTVVFYHNISDIPAPTMGSTSLKATLTGISNRHGHCKDQKEPMTVPDLRAIYSVLDLSDFEVLHFWAATLLLFRSLLRVSHVVSSPHTLKVQDVQWTPYGFLLRIRSSKTRRKGDTRSIPIARLTDNSLCAVHWVETVIGNRPGKENIFMSNPGCVMKYNRFRSLLRCYCVRAGLSKNKATHSLRRGGTTLLASLGVELHHIKEMGDWSSLSVFEYINEPIQVRVNREKAIATRF